MQNNARVSTISDLKVFSFALVELQSFINFKICAIIVLNFLKFKFIRKLFVSGTDRFSDLAELTTS